MGADVAVTLGDVTVAVGVVVVVPRGVGELVDVAELVEVGDAVGVAEGVVVGVWLGVLVGVLVRVLVQVGVAV
jgi:hypothetical protein